MEVIGHEIDHVKIRLHALDIEPTQIMPCGNSHTNSLLISKRLLHLLDELRQVLGIALVPTHVPGGRILPVDIDPVKAMCIHKLLRRLDELLPGPARACHVREPPRAHPLAAHRYPDLQVLVLVL